MARVAPVALPLLFAVAACIEHLDLGATEQATTIPLQDYDFGNVPVRTTSSAQQFTIRPASGVQSDTVESITESCPDFAVTATGLPATVSNVCTGGSGCPSYQATNYTFSATFTPTVAMQVSCAVAVKISGVTTTFTLTGRGTEPAVRMGVSPASALALGEVRVGDTSSAATVLVTNYGSGPQPLTVSSVAFDAGSVARGFAIASGTTGSHVVAPNGGTSAFGITCRPTATGPATGTLTIASDDPAAATTALTVSCTGIQSDLSFLPSSPALLAGAQAQGATRVGEPVDIPITLRNVGNASMTLDAVATTGAELALMTQPSGGTVLPSNGTTTVVVRYAAASAAPLGTLGVLTVTHDGGATRSINILGGALPTSMSINPDGDVDLGPVCLSSTASRAFYVLKNNPGTFKITAIDPPEAPFALTGTLPTPEAPIAIDNNAAMFSVSVTPTEPLALRSTFAVTTDIPGEAPREINLSATGLAAGVSVTPVSVDLGATSLGATSPGRTVTVTNCDAAPLTIVEAAIVGPNRDDFAILTAPAEATITPAGAATYVVVASPASAGGLTAALQIRYDGGMVEVPLTGTGTGIAPDDRIPVESTYYGCSASGGGGAATGGLVGLAGLLLAARRRRARCA